MWVPRSFCVPGPGRELAVFFLSPKGDLHGRERKRTSNISYTSARGSNNRHTSTALAFNRHGKRQQCKTFTSNA
eukprot:14969790-Alexandrium_andersonii.AAC.1